MRLAASRRWLACGLVVHGAGLAAIWLATQPASVAIALTVLVALHGLAQFRTARGQVWQTQADGTVSNYSGGDTAPMVVRPTSRVWGPLVLLWLDDPGGARCVVLMRDACTSNADWAALRRGLRWHRQTQAAKPIDSVVG